MTDKPATSLESREMIIRDVCILALSHAMHFQQLLGQAWRRCKQCAPSALCTACRHEMEQVAVRAQEADILIQRITDILPPQAPTP